MNTLEQTKSNVIPASFHRRMEAGKNQADQSACRLPAQAGHRQAKIVPFEKMRKTMKDTTKFHMEDYLDWLAEENFVNPFEKNKLRAATAPLFRVYPEVDEAFKKQVRAEFTDDDKPLLTVIADEEEAYWREAIARGEAPLPGFDYRRARAVFTAPTEERTTHVCFMKPEFITDVPVVDVQYGLAKANAFFHIILRMLRLQHEHDLNSGRSLLDNITALATDLPTEAQKAEAETRYETETDTDDDVNAILKQLRPRKTALWRKLLNRFHKK